MELLGMPVRVAKRHMKQHQNILSILPEAFSMIAEFDPDRVAQLVSPIGQATIMTVDFGRIIGKCECVPTTDDDEIVYAIRCERDRHMRFVKNRTMPDTSKLTLIMFRRGSDWMLVSGWFGDPAAREPQDPNSSQQERIAAYDFWTKHALVWGCQRVRKETITTTCPWPPL